MLSLADVYSQNVYKGKAVDAEDGLPVADVYICAYQGNSIVGYAFTDNDGYFELNTAAPYLSVEWQVASGLRIQATGKLDYKSGQVNDLMSGYILRSYRYAVKRGIMPRTLDWNSALQISYSSVLHDFVTELRGSYGSGCRDLSSAFTYYDTFSLSEVIRDISAVRNVSASARFRKWLGHRTFSVDVDAEYSVDWSSMYLQGVDEEYQTEYLNASASLAYHPASWLDITASLSYMRARVLNFDSLPTHSLTTQARLVVTPFKPFSIIGTVYHLYQDVPGVSVSNTPLLKISLEYRLKRQIRLFVQCSNVLNAREFRQEYIQTYSTYANVFAMRPRSWLAGVKMSF